MWSKIVLLGAFAVLTFSCSRFTAGKNSSSYNTSKQSQASVDNRVVVQPSKSEDKSNKSWLEIAENADTSKVIEKFDNRSGSSNKIKIGMFSARELQHVSISNYDPFDSNGEMFFDLKRMNKEFHYPANGHLLSDFGNRGRGYHSGVDIKADKGDNIYAAFDGVVRMSTYYGGYGNVIVIRHYNGLETIYSHNNKNIVMIGDEVKAGDVIAYAGKTGRATGYHVHFEVRVMGQVINPNLLISTSEKRLQNRDLYIYNRTGKVYASNNSTKKQKKVDDDDNKPKIEDKDKNKRVEETESRPTINTKSSSGSSGSVHKVAKGDNLYRISLANNTTVAELCRLNNIKENAILRLGQKIKVK